MVDAEDRVLGEMRVQRLVERAGRLAVASERLFDHEPRIVVEAGGGEARRDDAEKGRRDRQIVQRPLRRSHRLFQELKRRRVVVVAVDIVEELQQFGEGRLVVASLMLEAVPGAVAQLLESPAGLGDADDRKARPFVAHESQQRRKDLLVGEIAGRAEEHQGVGRGVVHFKSAGFSWCPPNSRRIADISLSAYSAAPRDSKRPNSAALRTGAGTPSSFAACKVQRPSPESDTRPENLPRLGSLRKADAVRSSSQEPITLPRRQSSATLAMSISYR